MHHRLMLQRLLRTGERKQGSWGLRCNTCEVTRSRRGSQNHRTKTIDVCPRMRRRPRRKRNGGAKRCLFVGAQDLISHTVEILQYGTIGSQQLDNSYEHSWYLCRASAHTGRNKCWPSGCAKKRLRQAMLRVGF